MLTSNPGKSPHTEWANRPASERFWTVDDMHDACVDYRAATEAVEIDRASCRVVPVGEDGLVFRNKDLGDVGISNWSFRQVCGFAGAPHRYLKKLPNRLAAECLNTGLAKPRSAARPYLALVHTEPVGTQRLDAITSTEYVRFWNDGITARLLELRKLGWRVPPGRKPWSPNGEIPTRAATQDDVLLNARVGNSVNVGDQIAPSGLYASDRDIFAFFVKDDQPIQYDSNGKALYRGMTISNSQTGEGVFEKTSFLFNGPCGNHLLWGLTQMQSIRIVHRWDASLDWNEFYTQIQAYADADPTADVAFIRKAMEFVIAQDTDDLLDLLVTERICTSAAMARDVYAEAFAHPEDGHKGPETAFGVMNGLTRFAQRHPYAAGRVQLDQSVGRVAELVAKG